MNIIQRAKHALFKKDYELMNNLTNAVLEEMRWGSFGKSEGIDTAVSQLKEVSGPYFDELLMSIQTYQTSPTITNDMRMGKVAESRYMYLYDPMVQYIIELWTDFGFGQKPDIIPRDKSLQALWQSFWDDPNNQYLLGERTIQKTSNKLLIDGEYFFAFFISKNTGKTTLRIVDTDEILDVVKAPGDNIVPLYWHRSGVLNTTSYLSKSDITDDIYYLDAYKWLMCDTVEQVKEQKKYLSMVETVSSHSKIASEIRSDTDVVLMQVAYRTQGDRGWPLLSASSPWIKTYSDFLRWRAAVQAASASVVEKIKAKTGQRGIEAIKNSLQSTLSGSGYVDRNPSPSPGSVWFENEALNREWMVRPTGAAEAQDDGSAIMSQAGLGGKIFPHWLGRGESFRLATATAMEAPVYRSFHRYQSFWSSVWRDMLKIVAHADQLYSPSPITIKSEDADVNTDSIINIELSDITEMMTRVADISEWVDKDSVINTEYQLIKSGLQTLGVPDIDTILMNRNKGNINGQQPRATVDKEEPDVLPGEEPTTEMMEDIGHYQSRVSAMIAALWRGSIDENTFAMGMITLIEQGMRAAWKEGMLEAGITEGEMSTPEIIALSELISFQWSYIDGLTSYIVANSREKGVKLYTLQPRIDMWVNRYNEARNQALTMASNDPKLEWVLGATGEHCRTCKRYNGKVKRASYWEQIGARPQSPNLECSGINCKCELVPTDKPLSRGYLTPPP